MDVPKHLSTSTTEWFKQVAEDFNLEPHHIRLLTLASEAWDRCVQARLALAEHGLTFLDRFKQPRARPEIAIERDSRIAFARLLRELALDLEPPGESRPPRIGGDR
jgi:phage terminase small subunit